MESIAEKYNADEYEFMKLLKLHHVKYFKAEEVFKPFLTHPLGQVPPVQIWERIIPALLVNDALREELDVTIIINSSYRCKAHNKAEKGSKESQHIYFTALDCRSNTPENTAKVKQRIKQWMKKDDLEIYYKNLRITPAHCGISLNYPSIWHIDCGVIFGTRKEAKRW